MASAAQVRMLRPWHLLGLVALVAILPNIHADQDFDVEDKVIMSARVEVGLGILLAFLSCSTVSILSNQCFRGNIAHDAS
jgi:hypothetical protein